MNKIQKHINKRINEWHMNQRIKECHMNKGI